MKILHIVGLKGHGKTTLMVELVAELTARGVRVGTIKHSGHEHDLDLPGKDSFRHHEAGGQPAAFITPVGLTVCRRLDEGEDPVETIAHLYADRDLVLVEGYIDRAGPKIEMWRAAKGQEPLAPRVPEIFAVVSDDEAPVAVPVWSRSDVPDLADRVLEWAGFSPRN